MTMLRKYRALLVWSCFAALISLLTFASTLSPSYSECQAAAAYAKGYNAYSFFEKPLPHLRDGLWILIDCEGIFLENNSGALTALATIAIAGFTIALWRATTEQARLTNAALELARAEFVATHRPKIILREAFVPSFVNGDKIRVLFRLSNIGESNGVLRNSVIRIDAVPPLEVPHFIESIEGRTEIEAVTLASGQSILRGYNSSFLTWDEARFGRNANPQIKLHFAGEFSYIDPITQIERRTAFRRELRPPRQRFYRMKDEPDFDYTD